MISFEHENKLRATLFRFRVFILGGMIFLGFWSPWDQWFGWETTRVWLVLPAQLSRLGWISLASATLSVTIFAGACAGACAVARIWGAAYLHAAIVYDDHMHADRIVADGPFRRMRNPLYLGTLLHLLALAILMSPSGAVFAIVTVLIFQSLLVAGEERLLLTQRGEQYAAYMKRVPRWIPSLRPKIPSSGTRPRWGPALLGELYFSAVAAIFLVLAWRYNAQLLERGVLIAFGTRIVLRAISPWGKFTI